MTAGDGVFRFRDGIAVAQVVYFSGAFLIAYHFRRVGRIGWFNIGVLAIFRLASASSTLALINSDSESAWAGVFVCESLGIIIIIFLLLVMLERINDVVPLARRIVFLIPQFLTVIDIGVSIGGFVTVSQKSHDQLLPTPYSQAGVALLLAVWVYTVGVFIFFYSKRSVYDTDEKRLLTGVAIQIPLLAIRTVYPLIWAITSSITWSPVDGNTTAYLLMAFLPELAIVLVSVVVIWKTPPLPRKEKVPAVHSTQALVDGESQYGDRPNHGN